MSSSDPVASDNRRSITLINTKGGDNLKILETSIPKCGPTDVVIDVKFCGLNFAECMQRQGLYDALPPVPTVPGYECSGVVESVGEKVESLKPGDRIVGVQNFGVWQSKLVLPEGNCFKIPDNMSLEQAAALPVNYVTASIMLFDQACIKPGQSVFVQMAAGGVGTAVGQLCKTVENVTVFGTASASKHEHCQKNGITHPIDYHTKDYVEEVKRLSPRGVDVVLDPMGGADSAKANSLLKPLGKHIHYGGANFIKGNSRSIINIVGTFFRMSKYSPLDLMSKNIMVGGLHVGKLMANEDDLYIMIKHMKFLLQLFSEGKISPVIDSVWSFEQVLKAMDVIHERKNIGKVLLTTERKSPQSQ